MTNVVSPAALTQSNSGLEPIFPRAIAVPSIFRVELDTRLVAAVQTRAGARCHRSANLIHSYYLCADVYRSKLRQGNVEAARAARLRFQDSEDRLREFLFDPFSNSASRSLDRACVA